MSANPLSFISPISSTAATGSESVMELAVNTPFFLAIAKQGVHSFMMLGAMVDGKPQLLARVGKVAMAPDELACGPLGMIAQLLSYGVFAKLYDEGIKRYTKTERQISYQAYRIDLHSYIEVLSLLKSAHDYQLYYYQHGAGRQVPGEYEALKKSGIKAFLPTAFSNDQSTIILQYQNVADWHPKSTSNRAAFFQETTALSISNTCRTSAKAIVEAALSYQVEIPSFFANKLKYQTSLKYGQPDEASFYMLPSPPGSFKGDPLIKCQLERLYQQIKTLPSLEPESPLTREKFDKLTNLYDGLMGKPQLARFEMLAIIQQDLMNNHQLFSEHRRPSGLLLFVQCLFGLTTSSLKMFKAIESDLKKANPTESEPEKSSSETNHFPAI